MLTKNINKNTGEITLDVLVCCSLPKKMANGQLYKQAGNAVSVDLITLIAKELLTVLQACD